MVERTDAKNEALSDAAAPDDRRQTKNAGAMNAPLLVARAPRRGLRNLTCNVEGIGTRSVARRLRRYRGEHAGADVRAATPPLAQAGHDAPFRRSGRAERRARLTRTGRGPNL